MEIVQKQFGRVSQPLLVKARTLARQKILKEFDADMPVKKPVLKFVLEASQASIARAVATLRAILQ